MRTATLACCVLLLSCSEDPNQLGGDPNVPMGQVGNQISNLGYLTIGDTAVPLTMSLTVVENHGGIATMHLETDLRQSPALAFYDALIPASFKDASGKIDAEVKFKITSEGIQDFLNRDDKPHTTIKYNASVGDQYKLNKSDGKTITRTVVARSNQDDFAYGFLMIKTITVEQDSRIPGIKKFVYRANHKFGIVYLEIVGEDGSSAGMMLSSANN